MKALLGQRNGSARFTRPAVLLPLWFVLLTVMVPHANAQQPFKDIQYLAGHEGYPKKLYGHLVLTDTAVFFTKWDKNNTPVFAIPIRNITDVAVSTDRKDASVGSKIMFGFLSRSRKDELVQLTTETAQNAEGIVFKVGNNQSAGIAAKIRFLMKRTGVPVAGRPEMVAGGEGAANATSPGGTLHSGPATHLTDSADASSSPVPTPDSISSPLPTTAPPVRPEISAPAEHSPPRVGYDTLPPGTNYVGDGRTKLLYAGLRGSAEYAT